MVQERPVRVERRLSAILAADMVGYSRLMHNDEEAVHAKLTALLRETVAPAIAEHGGRIFKNTGDGFLAEFPSAVEAIRAAMEFQTRTNDLAIGDVEEKRVVRQHPCHDFLTLVAGGLCEVGPCCGLPVELEKPAQRAVRGPYA